MPKLKWLNDADLSKAVGNLLETAKKSKIKASKKFGENIIDPFSAIFEICGFDLSYEDWVQNEKTRQTQKTLQNSIGEFHQTILGSCNGWKDMGKGKIIDLLNEEKRIIAEVKNKYNTISGGKLSDLYFELDDLVMPKSGVYKDFTSYHVIILPKKSTRFDKEFTPSNKKKGQKCPPNELIRQIDGASFYSLVTGEENALKELFEVIPTVINDITKDNKLDLIKLKNLFELAYGQ